MSNCLRSLSTSLQLMTMLIGFSCVADVSITYAEDSFSLEEPITVLNYNVFNGFRGGSSFKTGVSWINSVAPDIAGWQELVGWNEKRLQDTAKQWEHPYAVTLKGGGYNIGISSRQEIQIITRQTSGFWHGYLHCQTYGIDVIVCHLWPGSRRGQLKEANQLRDLVQSLASKGREVILMGDFNAHIASDAQWVNQQAPLIERRLPSDSKRAELDRFIVAGKWNFDVMSKVMEAPLTDIVRREFDKHTIDPTYDQLLQIGSFPTRVLSHVKTKVAQEGFLERIDFILTTPGLTKLATDARICRDDPELEVISDHYPVLARFRPTR